MPGPPTAAGRPASRAARRALTPLRVEKVIMIQHVEWRSGGQDVRLESKFNK